ncbi:multiple epidermal growth factor-like domains protein 8 [Anneissia japonica]|uniref:multiple epidermal growth factor-like domains protein 8 n=1 Tax=Anneissia japonica TaxID=1529436 RepID=UPI0014257ABC|nr:multiple epidermal growth factor-like domains protein 8 [Anneissia japonica]
MISFGEKNGAVDFKQNKSRSCVNFNISFQMWKSWRLDTTTAMPRPRRRPSGGEIERWAASQLANLLGSKSKLGLLVCLILIWSSFTAVLGSKCRERGRVIFNDTFGFIYEGVDQQPAGYEKADHCEWLIKAPDPGAYIVLQFSSFETECSYDFLFVYDGGSYQSPLLASLSGDTLPMPVIARSGMMLIYLYSDTNYVLDGFHASFIVEDCIFNCSGNGVCLNHTCKCNSGYTGEACQFKACPNDCGSSQGHGVCKVNDDGINHCHCYDGYIGHDCSLSTTDNLGWGSTFTISNTSTFARTAHGGVFHSKTNSLWMYGGFDMDRELDDIVIFNFTSSEWQVIKPNSKIQPVKMSGFCRDMSNSTSPVGWWGRNGDFFTNFKECRKHDIPPGLTWMKYTAPYNLSHPDEVEIIRSSSHHFTFYKVMKDEIKTPNYSIAMLKGFIFPSEAKPPQGSRLRVWLDSNQDNTSLIISNSPQTKRALKIQPAEAEGVRTDNSDIFPNVSHGVKYYLELQLWKRVNKEEKKKYFSLQLAWNGNLDNSRDISKILTEEYLQPFSSSDCSTYTNCKACLSDSSCGWCPTSLTCELRNGPLLPSIRCGVLANPHHHLVVDLMMCVDCSFHISCLSCTQVSSLMNSGKAISYKLFPVYLTVYDCPLEYRVDGLTSAFNCNTMESYHFAYTIITHSYAMGNPLLLLTFVEQVDGLCLSEIVEHIWSTSCNSCTNNPDCGWCEETSHCFVYGTYTLLFPFGQCTHWFDEPSQCIDCSQFTSCTKCLSHFQCGWCTNPNDHSIGSCLEGSFDGPFNSECTYSSDPVTNITLPAVWDYQECFLCERNQHNCSENATCINEHLSFTCRCNIGFQGDGANCKRICIAPCVHGQCRESLNFDKCDCDIGWTGSRCDVDCGCNGHSTCLKGVHRCDQCQHNTTGKKCDACLPGFYAKLDPSFTCEPCSCNGHGDLTKGLCHPSNGVCFCKGQTTGDNCEQCLDGLHGDPRNGGSCYIPCNGRTLLTNISIITVSFEARQAVDRDTYGFKAIFQVNSCPKSCYGNRECVKGQCVCREGYQGDLCETVICPNNCSKRGICNKTVGLCICEDGFGGVSCDQAIDHNTVVWTTIFDIKRLQNSLVCGKDYPCGRSGHNRVSSQRRDCVQKMAQCSVLDCSSVTERRFYTGVFGHSSVYDEKTQSVYVFGGYTFHVNKTQISDLLYVLHIPTEHWSILPNEESIAVEQRRPAVAGHTLTRIRGTSPGSNYLLLIGGYSPDNGLMNATWKYPYPLGNRPWIQVDTTGISPTGVFGHSSVYDEKTQSVYVFGGYTFHVNKTQISDLLYVLHIPTEHWSILPNEESISAHVFHSAVSVQNHMIVLGGSNDNFGFTSSMLAYRYMCNQWLNLSEYSVGDQPFISKDIAAVAIGSRIYVYGGQTGLSYGAVHTLDLPRDLCSLETTKDGCYKRPGCSVCEDSRNKIHCFNSESGREPESCQSGMHTYGGVLCNQERLQQRNCSLASSCAECVAKYPAFPNTNQTCKWCSYCPKGKCINIHEKCDKKFCKADQPILKDKDCPEYFCAASTCSNCRDMNCLWTNRVQWTSEMRKYLSLSGEYAWNCYQNNVFANAPAAIRKEPTPIQYKSSCPEPCNKHKSCQLCLESPGADSGWDGCVWSTRLNLCMSPTYVQLHCMNGLCGKILNSDSITCPYEDPCIGKEICGHCLQESGCGWCAKPNTNGFGDCMKGAINGADGAGQCSRQSNHKNTSSTEWHYFKCPQEDECENDHHGCWPCEKCEDRAENYFCECKPGYSCTNECIPQCNPRCQDGKGECVGVNQCKCKFGFVGNDCGVECKCNGHSDCYSVDQPSNCTSCKHNTMGATCEFCLPNFVEYPKGRGKCQPCREYCNGNSDTCISKDNYDYLEIKSNRGSSKIPVCLNCKNNTQGNKCEECRPGYFKSGSICIKCICNGNCDTCHQETGHVDRNACQNNTTTEHESETDLQKQVSPCCANTEAVLLKEADIYASQYYYY